MLDGWLQDLPERLLTHFVGGAWRAPLGGQMCPVLGQGGRVLGCVVHATPADLARARVQSQVPDIESRQRMVAMLRHAAPHLAQDLGRVIPNAPTHAALLAMADVYARTGAFGSDLRADPADSTFLLPGTDAAVLGVAMARLAEGAGLPAGALSLLHAPLGRYMKRAP